MSSAIEQTVKALADFEAELEKAKATAEESTRKTVKDAADWAASARAEALAKAQQSAADTLGKARAEAEDEATKIKEKGSRSLKALEGSLAKRKSKAIEHVVARLLGESA